MLEIGGWLIKERFYCRLALALWLWTHTKQNAEIGTEVETHLFFVGWYDRGNTQKLWTITVLGLQLQVAFTI
jgi:hypothetical protein